MDVQASEAKAVAVTILVLKVPMGSIRSVATACLILGWVASFVRLP